jgi:hypothetical protein
LRGKEDVDGRAKPGHDENRVTRALNLAPVDLHGRNVGGSYKRKDKP